MTKQEYDAIDQIEGALFRWSGFIKVAEIYKDDPAVRRDLKIKIPNTTVGEILDVYAALMKCNEIVNRGK